MAVAFSIVARQFRLRGQKRDVLLCYTTVQVSTQGDDNVEDGPNRKGQSNHAAILDYRDMKRI